MTIPWRLKPQTCQDKNWFRKGKSVKPVRTKKIAFVRVKVSCLRRQKCRCCDGKSVKACVGKIVDSVSAKNVDSIAENVSNMYRQKRHSLGGKYSYTQWGHFAGAGMSFNTQEKWPWETDPPKKGKTENTATALHVKQEGKKGGGKDR